MNANQCVTGSCKRRLVDPAGKLFPAFVLMVLPKCPACLAAYITVATGIGISLTAATCIRSLLLVVCVLTLSYFAIKTMRRLHVRLRTHNSKFERSNIWRA